MSKYIVLKLSGVIFSWGNHTTECTRTTESAPTFSAIAGMLGACFGVERINCEMRNLIRDSFRFAVRKDEVLKEFPKAKENRNRKKAIHSKKLVDYHTIQGTPKASSPNFNKKLVFGDKRPDKWKGTMISKRHYISDANYTVILEVVGDELKYEDFLESVKYPVYPIRFGRKCCMPTRPIFEKEIEATSFLNALSQIEPFAGHVWSPDDEGAYRKSNWRDVPLLGSIKFDNREVFMHNQSTDK